MALAPRSALCVCMYPKSGRFVGPDPPVVSGPQNVHGQGGGEERSRIIIITQYTTYNYTTPYGPPMQEGEAGPQVGGGE